MFRKSSGLTCMYGKLLEQRQSLSKYGHIESGLQFREASMADKPEVLSLRTNVYRGLDYLPDYYEYFIKDLNRKCIVGHIGQEMVSFGVMLMLDDGQTVLGQAGRVKEAYEGQGIFRSLTNYINSLAKQSKCQRRVALVETTLNKYTRSEKFQKVHREVDSKLHYAGVITNDLRSKLETTGNFDMDVKPLAYQVLHSYLTNDLVRRYLFPKETVLVDYVPLKSIKQNIHQLKGRNNDFFTSVRISDGDVIGLLSAGSSFVCVDPPRSYTIDLFGSFSEDLETHLRFHLARACQLYRGPFCLQVFVEKGFIAQRLCSILIKYDIPKCDWYVDGGKATKTIVEEVFH